MTIEKERIKIEGDLSCPYSEMRNNFLYCSVPKNYEQIENFPAYVSKKCNCSNHNSCEFYSEPEVKTSKQVDEGNLEKNLHSDKSFFE